MITFQATIILGFFTQMALGYLGWPNFVSPGDGLELIVSVKHACANETSDPNLHAAINSFYNCTQWALTTPSAKNPLEALEIFCNKKVEQYVECWDTFAADVRRICTGCTEVKLPAVYQANLAAFCNPRKLNKNIENLKRSFNAIKLADAFHCEHWIFQDWDWVTSCSNLLPEMNSPNLCTRHDAIRTCLSRLRCKGTAKFDAVVRKLYLGARDELLCQEIIPIAAN